jgi:hypothetical protein
MALRSWSARSVTFALVAALLVLVGAAAPPSGAVSAVDQDRVTGTSPNTGVTYSAVHSCMAQLPSAIATRPSKDVFIQVQIVRNGEVLREINDRVDSRFDDNRLNFQRLDLPPVDVTDGVSYRFRDVFVDEAFVDGEFNGGPVFMTITPDSCPDYADDQRGAFEPIAPQRVLDTRPNSAVNYSGPKPPAGTSVKIPASVMPDRPAGVLAVSLTVTLVQASRRGFAQVYPAGVATPGGASNVNTPAANVNVANGAVVPVAPDGSLSVFTSGGAHLVVDINGYFVEEPAAVSAGRLATIEPIRVFDTRSDQAVNYSGPKPGSGSTTTVDLTSLESGFPAGATAAVVNITATRTTGSGFVQAAAAGELVVGESSVLNVTGVNQSVAGLVIVPVSPDGEIDIFALRSADLIVDLFGWFTGDDAEVSDSGLFVPLTPERLFDSRRPTSINPNTFTSDENGCCSGTDASIGLASLLGRASAVFLNATAIGRGARGFVRIGGSFQSTFSTVNFPADANRANAALVPVPDGARRVGMNSQGGRAGTRPALTVDISGFFTI